MDNKGYKLLLIGPGNNKNNHFNQLIKSHDLGIDCVDNIIDCLHYLSTNTVDCLLLTHKHAAFDAIQCLQQLHRHRALEQSPLIFVCENTDLPIAMEALHYGASDCICSEQLTIELLQHSIDSAILRHRYRYHKHNLGENLSPANDALTQLPNRQTFHQLMTKFIASAHRYNRLSALLLISLNDLKQVNDTIDHDTGDELLQQVSARIKESLRLDDVVARINGNEFAMILNQINDQQDAGIVAQKICYSLKQPYFIGRHRLIIKSSIGIICFKDNRSDSNELLQKASKAMHFTKSNNMNSYSFYEETQQLNYQHNITLEQQLIHSIENQELFLLYQPICHIPTQIIVGFEVLLRWHNRTLNQVIMPKEILPIAQKSGFIEPLENWVISNALNQLKQWQDDYFFNGNIAINITPSHLCQDNFLDGLQALLLHHQININKVSFELTEIEVMRNDLSLANIMSNLKQAGVNLQIDDFGTGYSSMRQLKSLNIGALKIDREFIKNIGTDENNSLIKSMIALAESLKLSVIAEGIETSLQQQYLSSLGCVYGQGYYYSKPITRHSANEILKKYAA